MGAAEFNAVSGPIAASRPLHFCFVAEVNGLTRTGKRAVLELHEDGTALAHMFFDAATLEGLIPDLARCRVGLKEEVSPELDPGARIESVACSRYSLGCLASECIALE